MADSKRYQVVSACVLLPVREATGGEVFNTLYRPAVFLADPDNYRVKHNVDSGYIVEVGKDDVAGVDAAGAALLNDERHDGAEPGSPVTSNDPGTVNEAAQRAATERTTAAAKLPADGSAPDGRASVEVWREYAVKKGYDRAAVESSNRDEIKALFKS